MVDGGTITSLLDKNSQRPEAEPPRPPRSGASSKEFFYGQIVAKMSPCQSKYPHKTIRNLGKVKGSRRGMHNHNFSCPRSSGGPSPERR